jgi:DNA-binding NarL/FixJ family response regulator
MSIRVVLADDHNLVREGLRLVLARHLDIEVVGEAENGRQAIDEVRQKQPDIVVMDIAMENLNGIQATRQIVDDGAGTKVIALSAYSDRRYVLGMLDAGASAYVLKSNAGEELVKAIHCVMDGGVYLTPEVTGTVVAQIQGHGPGGGGGHLLPLSDREREVLQLVAEGKSSKEIAEGLFISVRTADTHRRNIARKLKLRSVAELTKYAVREGLTSLGY